MTHNKESAVGPGTTTSGTKYATIKHTILHPVQGRIRGPFRDAANLLPGAIVCNQMIIVPGNATMTSIELVDVINAMREDGQAELRHDNFMVKIEKHPGIQSPKFLGDYKDCKGRTYKCYNLPKREASLMVMSESQAVQAKVYDRLAELEAGARAFTIPTTFSGALRLAAEQADTIDAQNLLLEAAKPAIAFVDKYVDATGSKGFRQVCKLLGAKENVFRYFLLAKDIMYVLGGEPTPRAQHLDAGRFVIKAGQSDVSGHAYNSARFTPKGITWIAGEFAKYQLELCSGAA